MSEELTPQDMELLESITSSSRDSEKTNMLSFFKKVITMDDTTRVGNINETELGMANLPIRTLKELSLFSSEMGLSGLGEYFEKESHNITDTSLSRLGFLLKLVQTQKKYTETSMKEFSEKQKKGWFKKKEPAGDLM